VLVVVASTASLVLVMVMFAVVMIVIVIVAIRLMTVRMTPAARLSHPRFSIIDLAITVVVRGRGIGF
jgi:hypothetical protein